MSKDVSRTKNTVRSIWFGLINYTISMVLPFISRTVIIYFLGIQYVGLNSLFGSVLGVLGLAELGVGTALVYNMYDAVAKDDVKTIGAYLKFYKKCYRIIGIVILSVGLIITPFIPLIIKSDLPNDVEIHLLYLIYLFNTVSSYFLYSYRRSLFIANQRNDIISKVTTACNLAVHLLQALIVIVTRNFYLYALLMPVVSFANNIIIYWLSKKYYPLVEEQGAIEKEQLSTIKVNVIALLYQKIGGIVLTSVDTIVISAFLGLVILGRYNNYYCIITAVLSLFAVIQNSMIPVVGNSIIKETKEKNYNDFAKFHFIYNWINIWATSTFLCLIDPFITIWVGKENLLPPIISILLAVYLFTYKTNDMSYVYREAAGLWNYGKFAPIIAAIFNLITNIILIQIIGIIGVIISTIIANTFVYIPCYSYIVFKHYFKSLDLWKRHLLSIIKYSIVAIVACLISYVTSNYIHVENTYCVIILRLFVSCIISNLVLFVFFFKTEQFKDAKEFFVSRFRKRI